jgi:ferric-dicitrate binding protein FerR (iron transport regulator)
VDGVAVVSPSGRERRLALSRGVALFAATDEPGPYTVRELRGDAEVRRGVFTVSLLSADESNTAPRQPPSGLAAASANQGGPPPGRARLEVWRVLLAAGLLVLALEWWVFYRGGALPRPGSPRAALAALARLRPRLRRAT